jgi:hypothetical protein
MENAIRYIRGLYSLGLGGPFYRHSAERDVPWPHLDNPLRGADEATIQKWIAAGGREEEIREEVARLNAIRVVEGDVLPNLISNNLYKPGKVTYTSQLPYYRGIQPSKLRKNTWIWKAYDPDFKDTNVLPGHVILREFRILMGMDDRITKVHLFMGNKGVREVQTFENLESLIQMLQTYLGIHLVTTSGAQRMLTIPFFFSRDPCYGLPMFVVGGMEVVFEMSNPSSEPPSVSLSLEVLHSREEVKQIRINHLHRVEDYSELTSPYEEVDRWVFMNCCWKSVPEQLVHGGRVRLLYEGKLDEEIRGVFWKISQPDCQVRLYYEFEGEVINLVDSHPCEILAENELRTRMLPTLSGSFLTPGETRRGYGGIMLSKYMDSVDCEPGLSPRNGELYLEFSDPEIEVEIFLLTNRDHIVI